MEPITRVIFAGIDNTTNSDINGTPGHEYFPDELGLFDPVSGDIIILEGNTNGNHTNTFTVFIDWNENGDFTDEGEMYFAGSITNSTGTDGQQAITEIIAPDYVDIAETRVRIIKHRTNSQSPVWPTNPCGVYEYGQTEDYPLTVNPVDPPPCSADYLGDLEGGLGNLQANRYAADFEIGVLEGQSVHVNELTVSLFGNISTASIYFYEDNEGKPGELIGTRENITPTSQNLIGNVFEMNVYETIFHFQPVSTGNTAGEIFWLAINTVAGSEGVANFWETSIETNHEIAYFSNDGGNTWDPDPNGYDAAFTLFGICGEMDMLDSDKFDFSYFPNPVKDILKINSGKKIKKVSVYDTLGSEKLKILKVVNNEVNLRDLPVGIYFLKVVLENGATETFKIIKN